MNYYVGGKNVKEFDYNFDSKELTLTFVNGRKYLYESVSADYVVQLIGDKADSIPYKLSKNFKYKEIKN